MSDYLKIRGNKEKCDWDNWESEEAELACREFIDCQGCGAWEKDVKEFYERLITRLIKDLKEVKQATHVREFLKQFDDELIFDLACYLILLKIKEGGV
jgi:hypothetical protein